MTVNILFGNSRTVCCFFFPGGTRTKKGDVREKEKIDDYQGFISGGTGVIFIYLFLVGTFIMWEFLCVCNNIYLYMDI